MSKFITADSNFAGLLYYSFPDSYLGAIPSKAKGNGYADFAFDEPDGVSFSNTLGEYHAPGSVGCSDLRYLLQCVQFMRMEIGKFKKGLS